MEEYSGLKKSRLGRSALYVLAVLVLIIMVYPFFYTMMSAFKTPEEFVSKAQYALPDGLYLGNIRYVLLESNIPRYFLNSLTVMVCVLVPVLLFGGVFRWTTGQLQVRKYPNRYLWSEMQTVRLPRVPQAIREDGLSGRRRNSRQTVRPSREHLKSRSVSL